MKFQFGDLEKKVNKNEGETKKLARNSGEGIRSTERDVPPN